MGVVTGTRRRAPRGPAAPLLALVLALLPLAAAADWVETPPDDPSRYSLESITFEGDLPVPEGELRGVLRSTPSGFLRFRSVDLDRLEGDVQRLRSHLRRRGFWNAEVEPTVLFDHGEREGRAVFTIRARRRRLVGRVSVEGERSFPDAEIFAWISQRGGEPFDISRTARDRKRVENEYANRGFYQVAVTADIQPARDPGADPVEHDLVYRIQEGPRFFVGTVSIEGNEFTKAEIIRREIAFRPGEVLNRDRLDESRARLYATGYFSRVVILPADAAAESGTVDVIVRVVERRMRFVGLGVGYGTRDQLRLSGEWGHRNLWGRGKRGSVRGLLATELFPADLFRTRVEGRYVEPWLFGTRTVGSIELAFERRKEFFDEGRQTYDLALVSLIVNVNRQLTRHTTGFVAVENEWADLDADPGVDPPDDRRPDITRTVQLTLDRDRRDQFFDPRRGFANRFIGSVSGGLLGGDNDFWKAQLESSWFRTVSRLTVAGRVRVGYERPFGDSETVPDRQRFKLGGPNSVRGYDYQDIGPGDFLVLANVEMRFPLVWRFRGGLFLDGGNAWEEPGDVALEDFRPTATKGDPELAAETEFRYSVGAGLRFTTPVGPVRFDVARKLKILPVAAGEPDDENRWDYDLSLGHVF